MPADIPYNRVIGVCLLISPRVGWLVHACCLQVGCVPGQLYEGCMKVDVSWQICGLTCITNRLSHAKAIKS